MSDSDFLEKLFVKYCLKGEENLDVAPFLKRLFRSSLEGHLCLEETSAPHLPENLIASLQSDRKAPIVKDQNRYYLYKNWVYETQIVENLKRLKGKKAPLLNDSALFFQKLEEKSLLPEQKEAITCAFNSSFSVICGGPGTGKTYTAAIFIKLLLASKKKEAYRVVLSAPTGRAASHLKSVLNMDVEAMTLHRLLRFKNGLNTQEILDADLIIVDEASMLDAALFAKLLASIGDNTRLVLIGDPDQLPPVESGAVFADIADFFGVRLKKSMRVEKTALFQLAQNIQEGKWEDFSYLLDKGFNEELKSWLFSKIPLHIGYEKPCIDTCLQSFFSFRILGALRHGPFGVNALNQYLFQRVKEQILPDMWWAFPIMISANDPSKDLYNGTCGIWVGKGPTMQGGHAYFPKEVPFEDLPPFEIAFCLSIHKSQGSEFDSVLALFPEGSEHFGKEAVYTAVTRAKKKLEIVSTKALLEAMVCKKSERTSGIIPRMSFAEKAL